jgi:hypothetical protein
MMKLETAEKQIWFNFQKTKYLYDKKDNTFKAINFPVDSQLMHYIDSKGYQHDTQIAEAASYFGLNT